MKRAIFTFLVVTFLAAGCSGPQMADMEAMMAKPQPPVELAKLERMVGTWTSTAEMIEPTPEAMKAKMSGSTDVSAEPVPSSFKSGSNAAWTMDGMFLKIEGWHEMPNGARMKMTQYQTWDVDSEMYRSWWFSDYGEVGEGWAEFGDDPDTMRMWGKGRDFHGNKKSWDGSMKFVSDNVVEWKFTEKGPMGKMTLKGTNTRQ